MRTIDEVIIEEDFVCLRLKNDTQEMQVFEKDQNLGIMQFHFTIKGEVQFLFNQGSYKIGLAKEKNFTLYNPQKSLPIHLEIAPDTSLITIAISIKKFHALFSTEAEYIPFINAENRDKKHYSEESISPYMSVVLNQIMNYNLHDSVKKLYYKAKVYELLSLLFNRTDETSEERCPFRSDEENVRKIKKAKDYLLDNMLEPPTLQELADEVGLNLKKLKLGFKQIYGDTVYGFLFDYKMEHARKLLETGTYNVNEVGIKIGYSTASHFIAAFKKKFGTTPKKYLMALSY